MKLSVTLAALAPLVALSLAAALPQTGAGGGATVFCLAVCEPPGKICADGQVCELLSYISPFLSREKNVHFLRTLPPLPSFYAGRIEV
jgi:hypothetical protein